MTHQDGRPSVANLLEFLEWIAARPRTYAETIEAWRTSCRRFSAWEDATGNGLVRMEPGEGTTLGQTAVRLTERGIAFLNGSEP
jgi:hypothetical protein